MSNDTVKPDWVDLLKAGLQLLNAALPDPVTTQYFDLPCICAEREAPYLLRYRVSSAAVYPFVESIKQRPSVETSRTSGDTQQTAIEIDVHRLEGKRPCPWCGTDNYVYCGACRSYVCTARTIGELFRCRRSCGNENIGKPMTSVSGSNLSLTRPGRIAAPTHFPGRVPHAAPERQLAVSEPTRHLPPPRNSRLLGRG